MAAMQSARAPRLPRWPGSPAERQRVVDRVAAVVQAEVAAVVPATTARMRLEAESVILGILLKAYMEVLEVKAAVEATDG